jgi:Ca2+-binding EF-hand superfamily protein
MGSEHSQLLSDEEVEKLKSRWGELLTPAIQDEALKLYTKLDTLTDKHLNLDEFSQALGILGSSDSPMARFLFGALDVDHDGRINCFEFCNWMMTMRCGTREEKMRFGFALLDLDHDNSVSKAEMAPTVQSFAFVLGKLHLVDVDVQSFIDNLFERCGADGDTLTWDQYRDGCYNNHDFIRSLGRDTSDRVVPRVMPKCIGKECFFGQESFHFALSVMLAIQLVVERATHQDEADQFDMESESDDDDQDSPRSSGGTPRGSLSPPPLGAGSPVRSAGGGKSAVSRGDSSESDDDADPPMGYSARTQAALDTGVKAGLLYKKGNGQSFLGRRNWKRRFFFFKDNTLAYFKRPDDILTPGAGKGAVSVDVGCKIRQISNSKHKYHFQVWHPQP